MSHDVLSNYDLLHIIISFCDQTTICELLCSNKLFRVDKMNLSSVEVKGFFVHDFVKWLAIYQITTIEKMTISDYILSNDHCMDVYQEMSRRYYKNLPISPDIRTGSSCCQLGLQNNVFSSMEPQTNQAVRIGQLYSSS